MHIHTAELFQRINYRLARGLGSEFSTVIDVGASDARWSRDLAKHFPLRTFHLIEALPVHQKGLKDFVAKHPGSRFALAAAGPSDGSTEFEVVADDPFGGAVSSTKLAGKSLNVPMVTIDGEVQRHGLRGPFFIKLDTHGFELEILAGAQAALAQSAYVLIECYVFRLRPGALRFDEMCRHMESLGFRCSDMCEVLHRPRDGALWQMDLLFEPMNSPVFASDAYNA